MKNLLYLLMILPFAVKAQHVCPKVIFEKSGEVSATGEYNIPINDSANTYIGLRIPKVINDTVKIAMLVSDTSTVKKTFNNNIAIGYQSGTDTLYSRPVTYQMQDTRPFMMYGYQTSAGELLDAYKQKLSKNIVMWIAYKTK